MTGIPHKSDHAVRQALAVFVGAALYFGALRALTPGLIDPDEFFHVRFASLMRERGEIVRALPWAADTIHAESYRDHHFLQHVLYIPFVWGDLEMAARAVAALSAALMLTAFWAMARAWGWRWPLLWTALLAGSATGFVIRQDMARVQNLCLAFVFLGLWAWRAGSYRALFALAFANVWLYDGFLILPAMCLLCASLSGRSDRPEAPWRGVAVAMAGTTTGMVINPFLPDNFSGYLLNFTRVLEPRNSPLPLGNEWDPATWLDMGPDALPINLALGTVTVWAIRRRHRPEGVEWAFLIMGLALWAVTCRHQRFVEYWPAPAVMFAAAWATRIGGGGISISPSQEGTRDEAGPWRDDDEGRGDDRPVPSSASGPVAWFRAAPGFLRFLAIVALAGGLGQFAGAARLMRARVVPDLEPACRWLQENTPPDTKVFNACWWDFSPAFMYGPHNRFVVGLDLNYLRLHDPGLARHYEEIVTGREPKPLKTIREQFRCRYVLADQRNLLLLIRIRGEEGYTVEHEDINRAVLRLD